MPIVQLFIVRDVIVANKQKILYICFSKIQLCQEIQTNAHYLNSISVAIITTTMGAAFI